MTDREKVIEGLEFTKAMITFNPSTGEDIEPENMNEDNKTTYDACVGAIALLKEREPEYPVCEKCGKEIDYINTSVFNYDGSDSDYSVPITYSKENGCVSFSISQKWTGYDLTDEEQKEGIRCPYCGKFPFDDSIKIEFYEPVEVMMWTSESR